jgi:hypothetical protein
MDKAELENMSKEDLIALITKDEETQDDSSLFKQEEERQSIADKINEAIQPEEVGPITAMAREGSEMLGEDIERIIIGPAKSYFNKLRLVTAIKQDNMQKFIAEQLDDTKEIFAAFKRGPNPGKLSRLEAEKNPPNTKFPRKEVK